MGVAFAVGGFSLNGHAIRDRDRRGAIPLGADRKASSRIPREPSAGPSIAVSAQRG